MYSNYTPSQKLLLLWRTYLFKSRVYLLEQGQFLLLKEHPELGTQVQVDHPQQVDSGRTHSWVRRSKCLLDEVNEGLDVQSGGERGIRQRKNILGQLGKG